MKKLFYIESEEFLRQMVEIGAKNLGFEAYTVDNAQDIDFILKDMSPDVVLVDLASIKDHQQKFIGSMEQEGCAQIPVFFTGTSAELDALDWDRKDSDHLISKPFGPIDLANRIFGQLN